MMTSHFEGADSAAGEQRYRHLFDHMPVCIMITNVIATPAIILEANRRAELVYGYTAAKKSPACRPCLLPRIPGSRPISAGMVIMFFWVTVVIMEQMDNPWKN